MRIWSPNPFDDAVTFVATLVAVTIAIPVIVVCVVIYMAAMYVLVVGLLAWTIFRKCFPEKQPASAPPARQVQPPRIPQSEENGAPPICLTRGRGIRPN